MRKLDSNGVPNVLLDTDLGGVHDPEVSVEKVVGADDVETTHVNVVLTLTAPESDSEE